ncbi:AT hook [Geosmithia morbida]|uniref:AT hook n=1 Tax=Geosmithia morbida TaxID=1094350 RepID=A0A9P4YZV7_9HYPO|nr:AT hook [Geosmithia morbida]KAF4126111.1 AT hook [Geosmithia morbida]
MSTMQGLTWSDDQALPPVEGGLDDITMTTAQGIQGNTSGQMSPVSPLETPVDGSVAPTMANSTSSSCEESWGNIDQDDADNDIRWEQSSDDGLAVTKLEPTEDDVDFDDLKSAPTAPTTPIEPLPTVNGQQQQQQQQHQQQQQQQQQQTKQKRPRGRPRKHPLTPTVNANKVTKGRSKTGCITCRKRKKKCDEAKPRCMNCEKNAVVCEGYHEKQIWKSGKERAQDDRLRVETVTSISLPPLFHGVETVEDQIFWKHYVNNFSNVLTVEGEAKNAFKDIILHLANQHQGLMHSILSVSSRHIDFDAPYGVKVLQENPTTNRQALEERSAHHHDEAMKRFYEDNANSVDKTDPLYQTEEYQTTLSARYGQILCRFLQTRAEGNASGEHRLHLKAYQTLIDGCPPLDPTFFAFITEFFQYHIYADDMMWHPDTSVERLTNGFWEPSAPIPTPRLLGVADGLLHYMALITCLRTTIRENMLASSDPPVDYVMLFRAAEINNAIREWVPNWPPGDGRNRVGLLYKQMMFIYLFRTVYPPSSTPRSRSTFSGVSVSSMTSSSSSSSTPPQRRASMAAGILSSASTPTGGFGIPPPRGGVPNYVSLGILESFSPSDPAQTLLLIPCMVVGIACFDLDRRERVRKSIRAVRGYTGLRNCDRVLELLEQVWALMDEGDWLAVWDWQAIAKNIGVDVPCA